jgi:pyrimidine-nucleoside phosphorylase
MKTMADAEKLAELLKQTGESFEQKVSVVFTCMDSPLGYAIGNAIEIRESIEYLAGADIPDIDIITKTLAIEMLVLSGVATDEKDALSQIDTVLRNGTALSKFAELIKIQGGNAEVCIDTSLLPSAPHQIPILSDKSGYISAIDSQRIGYALIKIGAGRTSLDSPLDMGAGTYLYKKVGDTISLSEEIGTVHTADLTLGHSVVNEILSSITISDQPVKKPDTIIKIWR